jgi:methionine aminopeptidase
MRSDLGVHIDGFVATEAQSLVVQAGDAPVTGRAADVIAAARTAFDVALRLIRPGKKVGDVAAALQTVAEAYGCNVVEGVMSHEMKQFVIDGNKCVLNKPSPESKVEDCEFEENEVYAIDIVMSTGEGKPKILDEKATTVYKRAIDVEYSLKVREHRGAEIGVNVGGEEGYVREIWV